MVIKQRSREVVWMINPEEMLTGRYASDLDAVRLVLEFDGRGGLTITRDGVFAAEATYRIVEDRIEFVDLRGPRASQDEGRGIYRWRVDGNRLSFIEIGDGASSRRRVLTTHSWMKEK